MHVSLLIACEGSHHYATDLVCLCHETREKFQKGQKFKSVLGLSPGERMVSMSETKNNRRQCKCNCIIFVMIKAVVKLICYLTVMAHAGSSDKFFNHDNQHIPYNDHNCTTLPYV